MTDNGSEPGPLDRPNHPDAMTTPQDVVDSLVDRKGIEEVRKNFDQYVSPLRIVGMDVSREDVEIRDPPTNREHDTTNGDR